MTKPESLEFTELAELSNGGLVIRVLDQNGEHAGSLHVKNADYLASVWAAFTAMALEIGKNGVDGIPDEIYLDM